MVSSSYQQVSDFFDYSPRLARYILAEKQNKILKKYFFQKLFPEAVMPS